MSVGAARDGTAVYDRGMPRRPGAARPSQQKFRRCGECSVARPATEFPRAADRSLASSGFGERRRIRCPDCGHTGLFWSFPEVTPAEGDRHARGS